MTGQPGNTEVFEVRGLDELERDLEHAGPHIARYFLQGILRGPAQIMRRALSEEAPYDTGHLASDIRYQFRTDEKGIFVKVGPSKRGFYGLIQEFGAPNANIPAQHWMEETAMEHQKQVIEAFVDAAAKALASLKGSG